jgi:flagellin-specific chaperone FliS
MMNRQDMNSRTTEYQRQSVMQASPEELISQLYDILIQSCYRQDAEKASGILDTLIKSLNFDYEMSTTLYELYSYCKSILDEEKYEEVRTLIEPIRSAWNDGVVSKKPTHTRTESHGFLA